MKRVSLLYVQPSEKIGTWLLIQIQKATIVVADKFQEPSYLQDRKQQL